MLKGVCCAEGSRTMRADVKFFEVIVGTVFEYIDSAFKKSTAEINEEKAETARLSLGKLTNVERNWRLLRVGLLHRRMRP